MRPPTANFPLDKGRIDRELEHRDRVEWVMAICSLVLFGWSISALLVGAGWIGMATLAMALSAVLAVIGLLMAACLLCFGAVTGVFATQFAGAKWIWAVVLWLVATCASGWGIVALGGWLAQPTV